MADVGVVMPVYRQDPHYLNLALQSILNQSYTNFLLVIVLDGSPPETSNQIRQLTAHRANVHIITLPENKGVSNALNTGFAYLDQIQEIQYYTWVSSDNIHYRHFIETLRRNLTAAPSNVGLVYSSFYHIDAHGTRVQTEHFKEFMEHQNQPKSVLLDYCFVGVSFMYKKSCAQKIRGYWMEPVEDYEYWIRLSEVCDLSFIPEVLMEYRVNSPQSISSQLHQSKDRYRHWRFMYNTARHQARARRQIPPELTILFVVDEVSQRAVDQYESILEQLYSNFDFIIIDRTEHFAAAKIMGAISDPRVLFLHGPGQPLDIALKAAMPRIRSSFLYLYGSSQPPLPTYEIKHLLINQQFAHDTLTFGKLYSISTFRRLIK